MHYQYPESEAAQCNSAMISFYLYPFVTCLNPCWENTCVVGSLYMFWSNVFSAFGHKMKKLDYKK